MQTFPAVLQDINTHCASTLLGECGLCVKLSITLPSVTCVLLQALTSVEVPLFAKAPSGGYIGDNPQPS